MGRVVADKGGTTLAEMKPFLVRAPRFVVRVMVGVVAALLLVALPAPRAAAGDDDPDDKPSVREPKCVCAQRNACWHYLHAPVDPPDGPCYCLKCTRESQHDGSKVPEGWNP